MTDEQMANFIVTDMTDVEIRSRPPAFEASMVR